MQIRDPHIQSSECVDCVLGGWRGGLVEWLANEKSEEVLTKAI